MPVVNKMDSGLADLEDFRKLALKKDLNPEAVRTIKEVPPNFGVRIGINTKKGSMKSIVKEDIDIGVQSIMSNLVSQRR